MSALHSPRFGPIARISLGLTALLISLVLLADLFLGVVPGRGQVERQTRQRVAENLAVQITGLLQAGDDAMVGKTIQQVLARDPDIRAISVRRNDGSSVLRRGELDPAAQASPGGDSNVDRLRIPIFSGRQAWGEIELKFAAAEPASVTTWLAQPVVQMLALLGIGGFLMCYAYLRRAMQYLDPSASVPDRVRKAFDSLTEGLLIIDQDARIVLANKAFRQLHPQAQGQLNGQRIDALAWLSAGQQDSADLAPPWVRTLESAATLDAQPLTLPQPEGPATRLLVTSAPIADHKGQARGCMITFDDVTAVHRVNDELRSALAELQRSREHIEQQNGELRRLASRDPLTGCFNRRAFFDAAEDAFESAGRGQTGFSCVMVDIDHFKQFNDLYGHSVGDQVIQAVARTLSAGMRQQDILCRYGGEEFCIVLPGTTPAEAMAVAERLRADIEEKSRAAIRGIQVMTITASLGLATRELAARTLQELIEQADQALYKSKQTGRNRVTAFERVPNALALVSGGAATPA